MSSQDPGQIEILRELQSRRNTLSPGQIEALDELSSRFGLNAEASNEDIKAQQAAKFPTAEETGANPGTATIAKSQFMPDIGTPLRFLSGVGRGLMGLAMAPGAAIQSVGNPMAVMMPQIEQAAKASMATSPVEKAGRYAAAAIPAIGPMAAGIGERIGEGDIAGGLGEASTVVAPMVKSGLGIGPKLSDIHGPADTALGIRRRVIQSILKPPDAVASSGVDPVQAVMDLPPSASIKSMRAKVQGEITKSESALMDAINKRAEIAQQLGVDNGIDIEPILRSNVNDLIVQARRNGDNGMARQLNTMMNSRLAEMKKRLGGTYLSPLQILEEKRMLRDEINFKGTDKIVQNQNAAKLGIYRGFDSALDKLVPEASDINANYANYVAADKLIESQQHKIGNRDILSGNVTGNLKKLAPTALKTGINSALKVQAPEVPTPNIDVQLGMAGTRAYEFPPAPKPGVPPLVNTSGKAVVGPAIPEPKKVGTYGEGRGGKSVVGPAQKATILSAIDDLLSGKSPKKK